MNLENVLCTWFNAHGKHLDDFGSMVVNQLVRPMNRDFFGFRRRSADNKCRIPFAHTYLYTVLFFSCTNTKNELVSFHFQRLGFFLSEAQTNTLSD